MRWQAGTLGSAITDAKPGFACGETAEGGVFQIRMNNITKDGVVDLTKIRRIPRSKCSLESFQLRTGDVLFNATNSPELVGKSAVFEDCGEPTVFSNHFLRLRSDEKKLDSRFLARWLQLQFQSKVFRNMCRQWVNQATVGRDALLALKLPLPPVDEQRQIAAVLDQAEALRVKRCEALNCLEELPQAIFIEVFGEPSSNPKGWPEELYLNDVADIHSGITIGRKTTGKNTHPVPYLAVANVQDKRLDLSRVKTVEATEDEIERYHLQVDDLLLTEGGDPDKLGRGALWKEEIVDCIHQNHIFRVRLKSDYILPTFLSWIIGSSRGKRYFLRSAKQTTGIASINMTQLRRFPIFVPSIDLQRQFAQRVEAVDRMKASYGAHLTELDTLFASLQYRAFRGEL
jgi:type I restriction enzyme S subunit